MQKFQPKLKKYRYRPVFQFNVLLRFVCECVCLLAVSQGWYIIADSCHIVIMQPLP